MPKPRGTKSMSTLNAIRAGCTQPPTTRATNSLLPTTQIRPLSPPDPRHHQGVVRTPRHPELTPKLPQHRIGIPPRLLGAPIGAACRVHRQRMR